MNIVLYRKTEAHHCKMWWIITIQCCTHRLHVALQNYVPTCYVANITTAVRASFFQSNLCVLRFSMALETYMDTMVWFLYVCVNVAAFINGIARSQYFLSVVLYDGSAPYSGAVVDFFTQCASLPSSEKYRRKYVWWSKMHKSQRIVCATFHFYVYI